MRSRTTLSPPSSIVSLKCLSGVYVALFALPAACWLNLRAETTLKEKSNGVFFALIGLGIFYVAPPSLVLTEQTVPRHIPCDFCALKLGVAR